MMTAELGSTISQSQLTLSLFMLGVACGQVIFGPLSDQFGRLPVIRIGTLTFVASLF
jgi:DHA1 family bicyclomycin/chloramphenicol resistance-like MFS transporter